MRKIEVASIIVLILTGIMLIVPVKVLSNPEVDEVVVIENESVSSPYLLVLDHYREDVYTEYDVNLSSDLQKYVHEMSNKYSMKIELILAVMEVESNFRTDVVSKTNDYGIMQINKVNHGWLMEKFGFNDILDPKNNIESGVYILSELYHKYDEDPHKALMAYNYGEGGAKKRWNKGIYTSAYSRKVVSLSETY